MPNAPRLKSITGVSRALIGTIGVRDAVAVLIAQFGWDLTFCAVSYIPDDEGKEALWVTLEALPSTD